MARLGTHKHPAILRVRSASRAEELLYVCQDHAWQVIVGVEPEEPEDISDLEKLLRDVRPNANAARPAPRVSGNDYCPCGSGKKFKKCCGMGAV